MLKLAFIGVIGALATLQLISSASIKPRLDSVSIQKLQLIRTLSKEAGLPQHPLQYEDLCFTPGCLDAALELLQAINSSVDPCQDFYQYSCGRWISTHPIPDTTASYTKYYQMERDLYKILDGILLEPEENDILPVAQAKQFYKQCMDTDSIDQAGLRPLKQLINELGGWELLNPNAFNATAFDWLHVIAETTRLTGQSPVFRPWVMPDSKDTNRLILHIDQPELTLPMEILSRPEDFPLFIAAYEAFVIEVATELNSTLTPDQLRQSVQSIIQFESNLAKISSPESNRYGNPERVYNPFTLKAYQDKTDKIDERGEYTIPWKKYFDQIASSSDIEIGEEEPIVVREPDYVKQLVPILKQAENDKRTLANYIMWRVVMKAVVDTTEKMRNVAFRFEQLLTGAFAMKLREDYCIDVVNGRFGMALGMKYIEGYFDQDSKTEANEMIGMVQAAFKENLDSLDWMEETTKTVSKEKVDAQNRFVAYPEWINNNTAIEELHKGMEIGGGYWESVLNFILFSSNGQMQALRVPLDRNMWIVSPGVINAFYYAEMNAIIFPAGILNIPFFGKGRPKHQNYAGFGVTIGHEVTHGFDNRGSQFDKDGNLRQWWDEGTKAEYNKRAQCMLEQYDNYLVERVNMTINGGLTLGENIGDNGGMRVSYMAYRKWVEGNEEELRLPGLEGLSTNQLFFVGFANIFCENITDDGLRHVIMTDAHSPNMWRINGAVRNFEEFAIAFDCPEDRDGMNPPEEGQCLVW